MLRFDSQSDRQQAPPRNYLARREQLRLLVMVAALGLVAMLAWQVRSERSRAVLAQLFGGEPVAAPTPRGPLNALTSPPADRPHTRRVELGQTRQWLNVTQIDSIRDNAVFLDAETDAWFAILGQLKSHDGPLEKLSASPITYAQFAEQAKGYRGRTVPVAGTIQRVEPQTPAENELGIERLYRVILRPEGDEVWPIAVYTLEPPDGVPINQPVNRAASATAVFFKNLSYQSQAGAGTMPVVLARNVDLAPLPEAPAPAEPIENSDLLTMAAIAAVVALLVVTFVVRRAAG
ncbi:hypothetical protein Pla123a_48860 [Posidoniimonas polymericola]|uniref:Uncharacterized protein n=1 Tax=Posidoniimonas polymericola TaxID=2528002 RepID=A0A5C5XRY3_9BACT|nr:hypothetical protein [Posidoniimonas polymericola]TWT65418.1 hypothetical protein Pla123a_48860 [Posidoniimonas polymericola]